MLIYAKGNDAENIYKSFVFNERENLDDFETVLKKYDDHFVPQTNVKHEGAVSPANPRAKGKKLRHLSVHCTSPSRPRQSQSCH